MDLQFITKNQFTFWDIILLLTGVVVMKFDIPNLKDDKRQILNALLNKIQEQYEDDISIVACYGSYITGTANSKSDIDFYFIPKNNRGYEMSCQFIIDNISYDFWPLSWERAGNMAAFNDSLVSIIADAQVVYYCEETDMKRFSLLKKMIEDYISPENREALLNKSRGILTEVKALFLDAYASIGTYKKVRSICTEILGELMTVVAYANFTYPRKGAVDIKNGVKSFFRLPENFVELFSEIIMSNDTQEIIKTTADLIKSVELLIYSDKSEDICNVSNQTAKGFYEELKSTYNKLIIACDEKDYIKTYFVTNSIDSETRSFFGKRYEDFPDLTIPIENNFELIKRLSMAHEQVMLNILKENHVDINCYKNVDEFINSLKPK